MAYVVQIVSGHDVHEVDFMLKPSYAEVNSAIRSFSGGAQAKYADEDGDLCTLSGATFEDFLGFATQKDGIAWLRVELTPSDRPASLVPSDDNVSESLSDDWERISELDLRPDKEEEERRMEDDMWQQQTEISPTASAEPELLLQGQTASVERPRDKSALAPDEATQPIASEQEVPVSRRPSAKIINSSVPLVLWLGSMELQEPLVAPDVQHSIQESLHEEAMPSRNPIRPEPSMGAFSAPEPSAPESQGKVSCKVCCKPVRLYLPAPFQRWSCDVCQRTDFTDSDPMWACPTASACDWGMCMDCHEFRKSSIPSSDCHDSHSNSMPSSDDVTASCRNSAGWGFGRAFGLLMCLPFVPMYLAARSCHMHSRRHHSYGSAFPRRHRGNCRRF